MMTLNSRVPVDEASQFLQRTRLLIGDQPVQSLQDSTVAIPGCGGVGGATAVLLARTGIGGFILADPGNFDPPDMNRQWGATCSTLGQSKVAVYAQMIREINPLARITTYAEGVTEANVGSFMAGADVVVDGLDLSVPLELRLKVYEEARRRGLFCLSSPIIGMATVMMSAAPDGMRLDAPIRELVDHLVRTARLPAGFRSHLLPDHVAAVERGVGQGAVPSVGIAPAFSAGFVSTEVVVILLREHFAHWRRPICLPEILVIESVRPNCRVVHYRDLFPDGAGSRTGLAAVTAP